MSYSDYWNQVYKPPGSALGGGGQRPKLGAGGAPLGLNQQMLNLTQDMGFAISPGLQGIMEQDDERRAATQYVPKPSQEEEEFSAWLEEKNIKPPSFGWGPGQKYQWEQWRKQMRVRWLKEIGKYQPPPKMVPMLESKSTGGLLGGITGQTPPRQNFPRPGLPGPVLGIGVPPVRKVPRQEPIAGPNPNPNPKYRAMPELGGASRFGFF